MTAIAWKSADSRSYARTMRWYGATDTRPRRRSSSATRRTSRSGAGSVSASRNTSTSPVVWWAPYQHADAFPVQPSGRGNAGSTWAPAVNATAPVSSAEWSSTTTTSAAGMVWQSRAARRWGNAAASSRAGITTDTRRSRAGPAAGNEGSRKNSNHPITQVAASNAVQRSGFTGVFLRPTRLRMPEVGCD
jgi:hypothetical protein